MKTNVSNVGLLPGKSAAAQDVVQPLAPQWWKDAMLAVMLSKKAMAEDGEVHTHSHTRIHAHTHACKHTRIHSHGCDAV